MNIDKGYINGWCIAYSGLVLHLKVKLVGKNAV